MAAFESSDLKRTLAWFAGVGLGLAWIAGVLTMGFSGASASAGALFAATMLLPVPVAGATAAVLCELAFALPWPTRSNVWWVASAGAVAAALGLGLALAALGIASTFGDEFVGPAVLSTVPLWAIGVYAGHRFALKMEARPSAVSAGLFLGVVALSVASLVLLWPPLVLMTGKPLGENLRLAAGVRRGDAAQFRWAEDGRVDRATSDESFARERSRWVLVRSGDAAAESGWIQASGRVVRAAPGKTRVAYLRYVLDPSPQGIEDNHEYLLFLELPARAGESPQSYETGEFTACLWHFAWGEKKKHTVLRGETLALDLARADDGGTVGRLHGGFRGRTIPAEGAAADGPKEAQIEADVEFKITSRVFAHTRFANDGEPLAGALDRLAGAAVAPMRAGPAAANEPVRRTAPKAPRKP